MDSVPFLVGILRFKNQGQLELNKRIVNTLSINVICFFCSAVTCIMIILVFKYNGASQEVVDTVIKFAIIPGLVTCSANYYIYFWRSKDYRHAFVEQLYMLKRLKQVLHFRRIDQLFLDKTTDRRRILKQADTWSLTAAHYGH